MRHVKYDDERVIDKYINFKLDIKIVCIYCVMDQFIITSNKPFKIVTV